MSAVKFNDGEVIISAVKYNDFIKLFLNRKINQYNKSSVFSSNIIYIFILIFNNFSSFFSRLTNFECTGLISIFIYQLIKNNFKGILYTACLIKLRNVINEN